MIKNDKKRALQDVRLNIKPIIFKD